MLQTWNLPSPPPLPADHSYPSFRNWLLSYSNQIYSYINQWESDLGKQFNTLLNGYGKDIASAAAVTISSAVHQVTGTATITTIQQPSGQTAVGLLTLYSHDGFTLGTGGNIALANSEMIQAGGSVMLAYHPALKKWLVPGSSSGQTFTQIVALTTSGNSPYAVPTGQRLFATVTLDTGNFTANLSATPTVGDTVTFKLLTNPGGLDQLSVVPAGGFTIDGAGTLNIAGINNSRSLVYAGSNHWYIYAF